MQYILDLGIALRYFISYPTSRNRSKFKSVHSLSKLLIVILFRRELKYLTEKCEFLLSRYYESIGHQKREKVHVSGYVSEIPARFLLFSPILYYLKLLYFRFLYLILLN